MAPSWKQISCAELPRARDGKRLRCSWVRPVQKEQRGLDQEDPSHSGSLRRKEDDGSE